jgi:hypothetical protein
MGESLQCEEHKTNHGSEVTYLRGPGCDIRMTILTVTCRGVLSSVVQVTFMTQKLGGSGMFQEVVVRGVYEALSDKSPRQKKGGEWSLAWRVLVERVGASPGKQSVPGVFFRSPLVTRWFCRGLSHGCLWHCCATVRRKAFTLRHSADV